MHLYGATKEFSLLFVSVKHFFANSWTGEYDTANEKKYASIQETFPGNTLKCKKLNERLWVYDMVDCPKIPILRDHNAIYTKFIWGREDTTVYLLNNMNSFTIKHVLLWQKYTNTYAKHDEESSKWLNALLIASSTDELNIRVNENFDLLPII